PGNARGNIRGEPGVMTRGLGNALEDVDAMRVGGHHATRCNDTAGLRVGSTIEIDFVQEIRPSLGAIDPTPSSGVTAFAWIESEEGVAKPKLDPDEARGPSSLGGFDPTPSSGVTAFAWIESEEGLAKPKLDPDAARGPPSLGGFDPTPSSGVTAFAWFESEGWR